LSLAQPVFSVSSVVKLSSKRENTAGENSEYPIHPRAGCATAFFSHLWALNCP